MFLFSIQLYWANGSGIERSDKRAEREEYKKENEAILGALKEVKECVKKYSPYGLLNEYKIFIWDTLDDDRGGNKLTLKLSNLEVDSLYYELYEYKDIPTEDITRRK